MRHREVSRACSSSLGPSGCATIARVIPRALAIAVVLALLCAGGASAAVLYVGDSLGVGTVPHLRDALGSQTVDAEVETGRPSSVGVEVLGGLIGPGYDTVVFDLGTNDDPAAPDALAAELTAARGLAGDRCMVVATLNRPPLNGVSVDGLNRAIERFAAANPQVALVDWHAAVARRPDLLFDGVHAQPAGYELRAGLFAQAIDGCAAAGTGLKRGGLGGVPAPPPAGELEHEPSVEALPKPRSEPQRGPVHELAVELAKAIAVGAEFG